ncbi:hypothetical protein QA601_09255 [Chitinispirillales bacterium ANBcel5]|uniref:hypothetical protein n=1 Tax=Cellulosispirillum alkaliphilum TaxID=3039283 RepID=UPI002A4ED74C|nr:hypothetical protein [Chitinispirillales bacterium ANBcel5]
MKKLKKQLIVQACIGALFFSLTHGYTEEADGMEQEVINEEDSAVIWEPFAFDDYTYISGNLLASSAFLWERKDRPKGVLNRPADSRAVFQLHDNVTITGANAEAFGVGDTVDLIAQIKSMRYDGKRYWLKKSQGRAVVERADGREFRAKVIRLWGQVKGNEWVMPARQFDSIEYETLIDAPVSIDAAVLSRVQETRFPHMNQMFLIDKGQSDGVVKGDIFAVYDNADDQLNEILLLGLVTRVYDNYSTLVIQKLFEKQLSEGDRAVLKKRIDEQW